LEEVFSSDLAKVRLHGGTSDKPEPSSMRARSAHFFSRQQLFFERPAAAARQAPLKGRQLTAQATIIQQADTLLWRIRRDPDHMPKVNRGLRKWQ